MKETSARLLRLLGLLSTRPDWPGAELAARLGVSTRTVRRDIDRLRALDYPIDVGMGPAGGYRLGAGGRLPPLLLDDDEAVAVAVGLRTAAGSGVAGIGETALGALLKLRQLLPDRLRRRMDALEVSAVAAPGPPAVDAGELTSVAAACRDQRCLRFDYRGHYADVSVRVTEPHELVTWGGRWYLVAWDLERGDWRTFRVDRMRCRPPSGPRFTPRAIPGGDAAAFVTRGVADVWPYRATVRLHAPADSESARRTTVYGRIEPVDARSCRLRFTADSLHSLAFLLGALDVDFEVEDPPELADQLVAAAERFRRAASKLAGRPAGPERTGGAREDAG
ncbi:helix-turn-helix transcriptional regulator [Marinitenerispora sediminis]|uniref:DNA-binding transcriptional regulator n=1 Tax=Marinitenerispora sediminis TaxID=1931232 RepID=A0A368T4P1_9ACTN|nr:YafY family protein [Marinitenerispora sediminis]RCV50361.1 DNA-binding transcriptional regulator [Marinitenerispora sediminis]RCV53635.1 DNA-binding transcriptional regulator [Marinitenerispora sediminis]RCV57932.1 DNA-binding transcriptional regulator [Marinitenerispora sediminis]